MNNRDSLRNYLTYNRDVSSNEMNDIFLDLDNKLMILHQSGYHIRNLNSDNIVQDGEKFSFDSDFILSGIDSRTRNDNITNLAKLNIGAQVSMASGFSDFTALATEALKENWESVDFMINPLLEGDEYLKTVITKGLEDVYYNEYLVSLRGQLVNDGVGRQQSFRKSLSTEAGRALSKTDEEEAAFIAVAFYPIMIGIALIVGAVILSLI